MQLAPVRVFSCKHPLTTSALFFKQPGKLIRENKHLNASQLCKCWNISTADLWSDLCSSNLTLRHLSVLPMYSALQAGHVSKSHEI